MSFLDELEHQVENKDLYKQLGEFLSQPDADGNVERINDIYLKTLSFAGRTESLKKLAEALRILIELERKVYKIDEIKAEGGVEEFLRKLHRA